MRVIHHRVTVMPLVTVVLTSCVVPNESERITSLNEIEQVIENSIGWALTKDRALLMESVSQDDDFFIFHPDASSTIIGFSAFERHVDQVFMNEAFRATDFSINDLRITLSREGDVGWFSAVLDDHGEWQGQPTSWIDTRWTGVLERRDRRWVIVQMHFSFASDAQEEAALRDAY